MTSSYLELRFERDSDGTGELFACVRRTDYSGSGSAWFHFHEVETFGHQLKTTYPIPPNTELSLRGGYWKVGASPPELGDVLVGIQVYPVGSKGTIGVRVEVMDGFSEGQREQSRARLVVELLTDYESLRNFGEGIAQLVHLPSDRVRLNAHAA